MAQEVVCVVGDDDHLVGNAGFGKALNEVDGLIEADVAVVVGVNQQHWRLPGRDSRDR